MERKTELENAKSEASELSPSDEAEDASGWLEAWSVNFHGSKHITTELDMVFAEIGGMDVGDTAEVERIKISRKEYDDLPEFQGF